MDSREAVRAAWLGVVRARLLRSLGILRRGAVIGILMLVASPLLAVEDEVGLGTLEARRPGGGTEKSRTRRGPGGRSHGR